VSDEVLAKRVDKLVEKIDKLVEDILRAKQITDEDTTEFLRRYREIVIESRQLDVDNLPAVEKGRILGMTIELNDVFKVLKIVDAYFKGHKDREGGRMKTYDVVIEVKNIQAENEEEAKRRALGLITSLSSTDIKVETFEKRTIDDLVKLYGMTKIAHKMFTEGLFSLAEVKVKEEKESDGE